MLKPQKIISLASLLLLAAVFYWYISKNWEKFQQISLVHPWFFIPTILFTLVNVYSTGAVLQLAIEPFGVFLGRREIFGLSSLTRFSNQISPGYLGATVRAVYLKKNYDVSYAKFSSSFVLSNILQLLITGIVALLIYATHTRDFLGSKPMIIVLVAVALSVAILYLPLSRFASPIGRLSKKYDSKILERLFTAFDQFEKIKTHPKVLYMTLFWMLVTLASSTGIIMSLCHVLNYNIGVTPAVFLAALASWSIVFSITPGSIGVREGLMALGATLMGVPVPIILAVAVLMLLTAFVVVAVLSAYYAPKLLNKSLVDIKSLKNT